MHFKPAAIAAVLLPLSYADRIRLSAAADASVQIRQQDAFKSKFGNNIRPMTATASRKRILRILANGSGKQRKRSHNTSESRRAVGSVSRKSVVKRGDKSIDGEDVSLECDVDVGILSCPDGYACVASDIISGKGGTCKPIDENIKVEMSRGLVRAEGDCPLECPAKVCVCCYGEHVCDINDDPECPSPMCNNEDPECVNAVLNSCRDGSYIESCNGGADIYRQATVQAYCDAYVCVAEKGLTNYYAIANNEPRCDLTEEDCADCICSVFDVICSTMTPVCEQQPDTYGCDNMEFMCDFKSCCDEYGPECIIAFAELGDYTPVPTSEPTANGITAPTWEPPSTTPSVDFIPTLSPEASVENSIVEPTASPAVDTKPNSASATGSVHPTTDTPTV